LLARERNRRRDGVQDALPVGCAEEDAITAEQTIVFKNEIRKNNYQVMSIKDEQQ